VPFPDAFTEWEKI